jgi:hypothetical protein
VTTDANGNASFATSLPGVSVGKFLTATATDPSGNTSEFSQCIELQTGISINDSSHAEGNSGTTPFNFTVSLAAPSAKPVSVDFTTLAGFGDAQSGVDYQPAHEIVTFSPGETSKQLRCW